MRVVKLEGWIPRGVKLFAGVRCWAVVIVLFYVWVVASQFSNISPVRSCNTEENTKASITLSVETRGRR